jgi:Tol biopolymer transport system component/predicted Ser/Thr protein kinase
VERWRQIESLFQEALQRDPAEREAYLREACHGDAGLQGEVASLLANHHEASDFAPWAAAAASRLIDGPASLEAGHRLGPYEILAPIGKGGMGKVYKGRDTRLKRDVAIKICAAQFSERFEREARVIASLNHPNICQLYDVGPNFLVMELVEGENLSGPLPVETALNYARQIADALEAAHEKGVVHRDLKPANLKITPAGVAKVLDFGLAKAAEEPSAATDPATPPTITISPTRAGMILGTAAYMSPEQARGAAVDKRADIWAFGAVLYEILTGRQAFAGETTSDILAAVLRAEPEWSRIPAKVQPLLRRCFVKDPKHRLRDIGDAMPLLDGVPEPAPARRPWPWVVGAVLAIALFVTSVLLYRATLPGTHPLVQVSANLPPGTIIDRFRGSQLALSPDGTRIVVGESDATGKWRLAMRWLDQIQFVPLPGTDRAVMPFFSPDGQWIAFFADDKLKKIPVQGGEPVTLCDAPGLRRGASWGDDGNIVAAFRWGSSGLVRVPSGGGAPIQVTQLSKEKGETAHAWPQVLPGSQALLFTAYGTGGNDDAEIDVVSFKTGERKILHRGGSFGRYLPSGHLVYMQQNTLWAAPFDLSRLAETGAPQPVLEEVNTNVAGGGDFDFSQAGTLVYVSSNTQISFPYSIWWLDRTGQTKPLQVTPGVYENPRFSPDGKRLAFSLAINPARADIWVKDLERDTESRLTHLPGRNNDPVWTPDGKSIVFESSRQAAPGLYWIRADGAGEAQRLTDGKTRQVPCSFSPDGRRLAYSQFQEATFHLEIWTAPVEGDRDHPLFGNAEPFPRTSFSETQPAFSPDGHWLAYSSNESGAYELYVRPFPGPGGKSQISTGGGGYPIWSRDGRKLFFLAPDWHIMVADYTAKGDSFTAGKPQVWSQKNLIYLGTNYPYDLAPDGKRFAVVLNPAGMVGQEQKPIDSVTILLNFFDDLRRRAPAGGK